MCSKILHGILVCWTFPWTFLENTGNMGSFQSLGSVFGAYIDALYIREPYYMQSLSINKLECCQGHGLCGSVNQLKQDNSFNWDVFNGNKIVRGDPKVWWYRDILPCIDRCKLFICSTCLLLCIGYCKPIDFQWWDTYLVTFLHFT